MELRNEKDARFIIRHHVTEEKLLHLEKGVRKLGFQSGGKRIMSIFLGLFLLCMAAKVVIGGTIGDALMMIGILCAMGFVFGTYALLKGWLDAKKQIHLQFEAGRMEDNYQWEYRFYEDGYEVIGRMRNPACSIKTWDALLICLVCMCWWSAEMWCVTS